MPKHSFVQLILYWCPNVVPKFFRTEFVKRLFRPGWELSYKPDSLSSETFLKEPSTMVVVVVVVVGGGGASVPHKCATDIFTRFYLICPKNSGYDTV